MGLLKWPHIKTEEIMENIIAYIGMIYCLIAIPLHIACYIERKRNPKITAKSQGYK